MLTEAHRPVNYLRRRSFDEAMHIKSFKKLAQLIQAPVTHTLMGTGTYPDSLDSSLGMLGMHGKLLGKLCGCTC